MARIGLFKNLIGKGQRGSISIASPLSGAVIPLESVPDEAFAKKLMGDGVAVLPDEGIVVAPFDGVVETVPESLHAVGLVSDEGVELLVHVGVETVSLGGRYFTVRVAEGDRVKAGDVLIEFDLEAIRAAGYRTETPVIVVNGDDYAGAGSVAAGTVRRGEPLLVLREKD
ncbi:MAG: hypothetical protein CVV47_10755 [Spirochaetae bacterium HGW-Spirochaetae-3]|jgi:glucose-specific phosphotransferase system IIA component|nr:MAG: hypothetical protein CVV47_10755 [Spirochaetae bacterium HGW-Spirochaetae-3]